MDWRRRARALSRFGSLRDILRWSPLLGSSDVALELGFEIHSIVFRLLAESLQLDASFVNRLKFCEFLNTAAVSEFFVNRLSRSFLSSLLDFSLRAREGYLSRGHFPPINGAEFQGYDL